MNELGGKVAIVTGGASGIGLAAARLLSIHGAALALLDRNDDGVDSVAQELRSKGNAALAVGVELSDAAAISAAMSHVFDRFGRADILVNCAGITGKTAGLLDTAEATWDQVYAVNVKAPFLLIQAVARRMIAQGDGGRIVNVSSSSAHRARMSPPAYGSSKAALEQLTRTAAAELGLHGINVNAVAPGVTETPTGTGQIDPAILQQAIREGPISNLLGRVSQPEDIAQMIVFLCLPASRQITGQTIHVSAGAIV